ncbi:acyl carrier protein [Defluviimonas aestuarii]|uniref:acyl carrier protein n=1 Tax=Albidovulum aestuarii TaxID=1130726 RepID=UPI00249B0A69|nr:acyl carrier protein [Defluviimonas aestuarii]MDI3338094.1 acyl carrier protein [Defluviimonas aestuarii]
MTQEEIETALIAELSRIAPDIDLEDVDRGHDLREEFDIDSIDFLNLVTALGKRFGLDMPEADYPQMDTFDHLHAYLVAKSG